MKSEEETLPLTRAFTEGLRVRIPNVSVSHDDIVQTVKKRERKKMNRFSEEQESISTTSLTHLLGPHTASKKNFLQKEDDVTLKMY